eukprot:TRINITY_DN19462_c0_g1_i1.p1 TRINITY_DN19462_c0_g1~~TRINITY_DN19462_c0_g1_i1.p1  ORF type:complete len:127 (-),score=12.29 TRINITY_DN19462_c0_g1_i1:503-883(-)
MRSLSSDVDTWKKTNGVRSWTAQNHDVAYDVEIIIDEFMYHVNRQQHEGGFAGYLLNTIHRPMGEVKSKSQSQSQRYSFQRIEEGTSSSDGSERCQSLFIHEGDITMILMVGMSGLGKYCCCYPNL